MSFLKALRGSDEQTVPSRAIFTYTWRYPVDQPALLLVALRRGLACPLRILYRLLRVPHLDATFVELGRQHLLRAAANHDRRSLAAFNTGAAQDPNCLLERLFALRSTGRLSAGPSPALRSALAGRTRSGAAAADEPPARALGREPV